MDYLVSARKELEQSTSLRGGKSVQLEDSVKGRERK
jgi:hypothetical protein